MVERLLAVASGRDGDLHAVDDARLADVFVQGPRAEVPELAVLVLERLSTDCAGLHLFLVFVCDYLLS